MSDQTVPEIKAMLRAEALARRDALEPVWRAQASRMVAERALAIPALREASLVGGFWPIRSELDPRPLMEALHAREQAVCLPVVAKPLLLFRLWKPGDELVRRGFGLSEPHGEAPDVSPDALLVPLAAFDRRGGRIGYGKGHFDRVIAALSARHRIFTLGLAFSAQEVASVPVEAHDRPVDMILTETELVRATPS